MKKIKIKATPQPTQNLTNSSFEDFMSLLFVSAFLLIDFLSYFNSLEILAPQYLYLTGLNICIGLYVYANPVLSNKALFAVFKRSYIFKLYLLFILLCGISILFAKNKSLGVLSVAEILVVFTLVINFSILLHNRLYLIYKIIFLIGISAFFQAGIALYNFDTLARSKSVIEALSSNFLKGNTGNMNILSASLLYKVLFIYFGLIYYNKWKRWFLAFALVFATTIIFLINARASLLSFIIVSICFLIYQIKLRGYKKEALMKLMYILLPIIVSISIVNFIFKQSNLSGRYASTTERLKKIDLGEASASARLHYYNNAITLAKNNILHGVGLGNYRIESIPYELRTNANVSLHTHNDFLEITAETGVLNGVVYLSIFVLLLIINLKRLISSEQNNASKIAFITLLLLVIYGVDAMLNFPFYRPTMQICFCFIMVFTFVNQDYKEIDSKVEKKSYLALIVLAIIPFYVTYHAYQTSILENLIQTDNINFNQSGVVNGDQVINRNPKFPNVFQTSESFVEYAGIYYLREKKYDLAQKYLDSGNKINPYLGRPDFYKHLVAIENGLSDSAYFYIKSAFYKRPINDNFYAKAVDNAGRLKDTSEIIKMYNACPPAMKIKGWISAFTALKYAGYSKKGVEEFKQIANKEFPNDSLISKAIKESTITELIVKGQSFFAAGKRAEALNSYLEGFKIDPTNIYINQNIGFYYFNLNDFKKAITYFKKALVLPGLTNGKTEYYIAISYLNIGDKANSCRYFRAANNYPDAKDKLAIHCK